MDGDVYRFGDRVDDVAKKIGKGLEARQTYKFVGVDYPAMGVPALTRPADVGPYVDSMLKGAAKVQTEVRYYIKNCPSSRLIRVGYSQGAFAVHWGLFKLGDDPAVAKAVRSVILLADPLNYGKTMRQRITSADGKLVKEHAPTVAGIVQTGSPLVDIALHKKLGKSMMVEVRKSNVPLLVDHTRTLSICASGDLVCATVGSSKVHSAAYYPAAVSDAASAFALRTVKKTNGNGICEAGELCAYDTADRRTLLTDWGANLAPGNISTFNISVQNDKTSSVWNRTPYSVTAVNEKVSRGDEKLVLKPGSVTDLTKVKKGLSGNWSNVVDHFDVSK